MNIVVLTDHALFDRAIRAGADYGKGKAPSFLAAPLDGVSEGQLDEAWNILVETIDHARTATEDRIKELISAGYAKVEEILSAAKNKAKDIRAMLWEKLRAMVQDLIDGMLAQIRPELTVGGRTLYLNDIQVTQKVVLSGSIKASLADLCALASQGETQVTVNYIANPGT